MNDDNPQPRRSGPVWSLDPPGETPTAPAPAPPAPESEHAPEPQGATAEGRPQWWTAAPWPPVSPEPPPAAAKGAAAPAGGRGWLAVAVIAALIGGVTGAGIYGAVDRSRESPAGRTPLRSSEAQPGSNSSLVGSPLDIQGVLDKVQPAVVAIGVAGFEGRGAGTGMILTPDGEVLTNNHVVQGAARIQVTLYGESEPRQAEMVGADEFADLAVIKIRDASGLPTVELGSSSAARVGDDVIAIGNALALPGGPTVTQGIISAKDRTLGGLDGLIQTDAAINRGNAGGPLVNAAGQVIGINTAVIRGGGSEAEGIGLAIAIDPAKQIIEQLRKGGLPPDQRAFLGVSTQDLSAEVKENIQTGANAGAVVAEVVPGSAAAAAGLRRFDVIVSIDGKEVRSAANVGSIIRTKKPGDEVRIEYFRGDDRRTTTATLATRPSDG